MKSNQYELMNEYLDWYENLLTDKQREVMNMYFREDYSLKEIADNLSITRSAVADLVKRVEATLTHYEEKLHLVQKFHERTLLYEALQALQIEQVDAITNKLINNE
ncbi:MAG: DNA-binding protein [Erysipelotrichia bacterium]|nr:DNA-binding protein [Erysipelotrichia bacterium]NCC54844.1 DNA-binding protein [Erysipelotrichia bacterium]